MSRFAIDQKAFYGKVLSEFAGGEKSPGLVPGTSPFLRLHDEPGLVARACPLMCNREHFANGVIHWRTSRKIMPH